MRKRRLRLALIAVALLGVGVWLVWPTTPAPISAAKEKYARLELGMSEAEVAAILSSPPEMNRQLYGEWVDDRHGSQWYKLTDSPDMRKPEPRERLYNWRAWTFSDGPRSAWSVHYLNIQAYFDQGRLVAAAYYEGRDNAVKKWVRGLPFRPSRALPFLEVEVDKGRKAVPPP